MNTRHNTKGIIETMSKEVDYAKARLMASEELVKLDLNKCCANAGVDLTKISGTESQITIPYLQQDHFIRVGNNEVSFDDKENKLTILDQVVILHYLIRASGAPIADRWITFREVPSGPFYYDPFVKRAVNPLVKCFGHAPQLLDFVAQKMGETGPFPGDKALKCYALPRVPVILSIWQGDDEFLPQANIFFDATVSSYLPTEDLTYVASAVVYKAIKIGMASAAR